MKSYGVKRVDGKLTLWMQAGAVLLFTASAAGYAMAQTAPMMAVPAMPDTPHAAVTPPTSVQPSISAVAAAIAPVAGAPSSTPVAGVPSSAPSSSAPSAAEMAIVQNAAALNNTSSRTQASAAPERKTSHVESARMRNRRATDKGLRVTDILATPAQIRPLPKKYLVVKRDYSSNDSQSLLTAARLAFSNEHYAAALGLFNDLFRRNPNDLRVLMGRALAMQKLGQNQAAMDTYRRILKIDPDSVSAMTNMLGLIKGEDTPSAISALQRLRRLYPANVAVTAQLGMLYGVAGEYSNALKYLDMAEALRPGDGIIMYNRAVAYDHVGKAEKAAELYRRILNLASEGKLNAPLPLDDIRQRLATLP